VNAVHVWGIAEAYGGHVLLRLEDHDGMRCRPEYETALLDDLDWLGFEPQVARTTSFRADPAAHPQRQSNHSDRYTAALHGLDRANLVYACVCTRRLIAAAASHAPGEEPRYPGSCRAGRGDATATAARRVCMAPGVEVWEDIRLGLQRQDPAAQCGDVLVRDRHAQWTYQFAVVVDDMTDAIDVVVRGEDLLASTGRQLRLARLLGRTHPMQWLHHSLVTHPDGVKLSKANRDTSLRERRDAGASPAELFGEAAWRAGLLATPRAVPRAELAALFV